MPRMLNKKTAKKEEVAPKKQNRDFSRLRGMKDVLFDEYKYWNLVRKKTSDLARFYGFMPIETPIMECADLYDRSTGRSSDIVTKEMYSFVDKGGDRVALRPEATPGLVRAYNEHGMLNLPHPVKMFWMGPLFRHDKPQSGRYRQFHQADFEMFGEAGPVADAQLILIAYNIFKELQIDVQVQINSIGCKSCRDEYITKLLEYYKERGKRAKLCLDCKKRLVKNPLRLLDCKEEKCIEMREDAPQMVDSLCNDCRDHFIKSLEYLDELSVPYNLNPYLVRGLDYYNRTVFEIWSTEDDQGRQSALGGGGRYDSLVEHMGGRPTPACGFAIGIERTILKIKDNNIPLKQEGRDDVFLAQLGDSSRRKAMIMFEELRKAGINVRQSFTKDSLKAQLEEANLLGVKYSLILGQKELVDGTILLRDMESGIQEVVDAKKVKQEIEKRLTGLGLTTC
jgi:histidyl-tRNA synthetase